MTATRKGTLLSLASALSSALFLIPYKAAGQLAPRDAVVLATLGCAAVINTLLAVSGHLRSGSAAHGAGASAAHGAGASASFRATLIIAAILGVFTALGNSASAEALVHLDAGLTSALQQSQVLFVAGAAHFALGERITMRFLAGSVIAIAGFVVAHQPVAQASSDSMRIIGMLCAVGSAAAFGMINVITRKVIHRIAPLAVNALRLWIAVAGLACVSEAARDLSALSGRAWLLCLAAAFSGPFLGRVTIMYAVRYMTASHSTLLTLCTPVFAFAFGFAAFGSIPSLVEIIGALLILAGVVWPMLELAASSSRPQ